MKSFVGIVFIVVLVSTLGELSSRTPVCDCGKSRLYTSHGVVVWSISGDHHAIFFKSGFAVDADGAYRAYHPDDRSGLDALEHAGHPGDWWALVTDNEKRDGRPVLQGQNDPAPGFYVSTTALYDRDNQNVRDPRRYVDAAIVPYIVLQPKALKYAKLGDFATVMNLQNGKTAGAIVADVSGPNLPLGEGSIALAKALGVDSNTRTGGKSRDVVYVIYPGSGNRKPRGFQEITTNSERMFETWGGLDKLKTCLVE